MRIFHPQTRANGQKNRQAAGLLGIDWANVARPDRARQHLDARQHRFSDGILQEPRCHADGNYNRPRVSLKTELAPSKKRILHRLDNASWYAHRAAITPSPNAAQLAFSCFPALNSAAPMPLRNLHGAP
ncbi:MAG: hypothetical protein KDI45_02100 [Candidatus Accumulibacter sp.]|nr:hypothetical protein [Accumulibacter sp.]